MQLMTLSATYVICSDAACNNDFSCSRYAPAAAAAPAAATCQLAYMRITVASVTSAYYMQPLIHRMPLNIHKTFHNSKTSTVCFNNNGDLKLFALLLQNIDQTPV